MSCKVNKVNKRGADVFIEITEIMINFDKNVGSNI